MSSRPAPNANACKPKPKSDQTKAFVAAVLPAATAVGPAAHNMERIRTSLRPNWQSKVEEVGLTFHTPEGQPYWDESVHYQLTSAEVDTLERAGNDVYELCLK